MTQVSDVALGPLVHYVPEPLIKGAKKIEAKFKKKKYFLFHVNIQYKLHI